MKSILQSFLLLMIMMATFVNDFQVGGVYAFYFIWLAVVAIRCLCNIELTKLELQATGLSLFVLSPPALVELFVGDLGYFNFYVFAVLYVGVLFAVPYVVSNKKVVYRFVVLFLSVTAVLSLLSIFSGAVRAKIIFGPNVLYRIYGFLFMLYMLAGYFSECGRPDKNQAANGMGFYVVVGLFLISMAATGSRGALLVSAVIFFYLFVKARSFGFNRLRVTVMISPVIATASYFLLKPEGYFWRLTRFDVEANSEAVRVNYFSDAIAYASEKGGEMFWGLTSNNALWDNYPHNIFLESLVYGGWWLFATLVFMVFALLWGLIIKKTEAVAAYFGLYIPVFVGANLSGNMAYNFSVLSVLFVVTCIVLGKPNVGFRGA